MNALTIWVCEGAYKQTRGIIVSHAQHDSLICLLASAVLYVNKSNPLHGKQYFFLCTSAKICIQRIVTLLQFFITEYLDALFFLSWHAAKSFIKNLTLESFIPTSMLSINKKTMWLGVTSNASEVPNIRVDTDSWRHLPRHLVRFSHAFPLDSFSRAA